MLIGSVVCFSVSSCVKNTNTTPSVSNKINCNIKLDSATLELYRIDTQTVNVTTKLGVNNRGSIEIDSTQSLYVLFTFNNGATTITKHQKNFNYPARVFKIENNFFYYGDDMSAIDQCTENSLVLYNEINQVSVTDIKVQWSYLRKK